MRRRQRRQGVRDACDALVDPPNNPSPIPINNPTMASLGHFKIPVIENEPMVRLVMGLAW